MKLVRSGPVRLVLTALAAVLGLGIVGPAATAASAAPALATVINAKFFNQYTGLALDIVGPSTVVGTRLNQANPYNTSSELWTLAPHGNYYAFINQYSGQCMDIDGPSKSNGAAVHQWPCYYGDNQLWSLSSWAVLGSNGSVILEPVIINKYSGKCLDVTGFNASAGALLQQWSCSGDWNQQFHYVQYT
jgi:glucosylceramidase